MGADSEKWREHSQPSRHRPEPRLGTTLETVILTALLIIGVPALLMWLMVNGSLGQTREARREASDWRKEVSAQLGLTDVAGSGNIVGVHLERHAFAFVKRDGTGKWVPFDAVAGVELTPFFSTFEEGTGETKTRRGSQLIGAGLGAAIAGPAGLIVGGLSGGSTSTHSSSSSEVLDAMELKVRLFSDAEPLMKINMANSLHFDPVSKQYEGELDGLERLAARLATEIERRGPSFEKPQFASFEAIAVKEAPRTQEGWWSSTFGG